MRLTRLVVLTVLLVMPQSTRCPLCLPASRHTSVSFTSFGSLSMPMYHICCHLHPGKKKKGNQRDLKAQRGKTKEGLNVTTPAGWWHFTSTVSLCEFRFCSQICYYSDNESNLITDEEQRLFCWHVGFQSYFKGLTQEKMALIWELQPFHVEKLHFLSSKSHYTLKIRPAAAVQVSSKCKCSRRCNRSNASRLKASMKQPVAVWK